MINCDKYLFYGYENRASCLINNQPTSTMATMTTSSLITPSTEAESTTDAINATAINAMVIIIFTIIALLGFFGLAWCIIKRLIIRAIVRRFADAMQTKFKASKLAGIWNDAKNEVIAKDLDFISQLRKKLAKKTGTDLESQNKDPKTVSYYEY